MHVPLRLPHVAAIGGSGAKTTKRELFCVSAGEPQPTHHPPPTAFLLLLPSHLHHAFTSSRGRKTEQEGVGGGRRGGEGSPCILLNRLQTEKKKKNERKKALDGSVDVRALLCVRACLCWWVSLNAACLASLFVFVFAAVGAGGECRHTRMQTYRREGEQQQRKKKKKKMRASVRQTKRLSFAFFFLVKCCLCSS